MRLIYTVEINEEIFGLDGVLRVLDDALEEELGSVIVKSRIESRDEVCEKGNWEDEI